MKPALGILFSSDSISLNQLLKYVRVSVIQLSSPNFEPNGKDEAASTSPKTRQLLTLASPRSLSDRILVIFH
jgi:hypothetical protein